MADASAAVTDAYASMTDACAKMMVASPSAHSFHDFFIGEV